MTNQRFTLHLVFYDYDKTKGEAELRDNGQPLLISEDIGDMRVLAELLNELNTENNTLREEIKDFQTLLASREEVYLNPVIQTIREAYETERTAIGKSVLKQLLEEIQ